MRKQGQRFALWQIYFLPDIDEVFRYSHNCTYELRILEAAEFAKWYIPEWRNALCADRKHLDRLAEKRKQYITFKKLSVIAEVVLVINCLIVFTLTLSFLPAYGMRAVGDVRFSMMVSCISMWLCRVTLCVFLRRYMGFGPMGVWIGMFADWTVRGIIFAVRFKSRKWLQ